jgi:carbon-monoxide dehydrogenase large subunit
MERQIDIKSPMNAPPTSQPNHQGIGAPLRRVEDRRFLTGCGVFVADVNLPGALACALVRSPHAHAAIRRIDASDALASPGVIAVFTGADMAGDSMAPMRPLWVIRSNDGSPMAEPPRFALARETVRHVGEPVAAVVAESLAQATDAAERLAVEYEPLAGVTDARETQARGAPQLHACAPGNVCFRWARGDEAAVRAAFRSAAHVVAIDLVNNRLIGAAIEPRAVIGSAEPQSEKLTLYSSTQAPHHIRRQVTEQLGIPESAVRVVSPDVGGGFGYKGKLYPEEGIIAWVARRLRRPVRWVASRAESFVADNQARDHLTHAELALDADGAAISRKSSRAPSRSPIMIDLPSGARRPRGSGACAASAWRATSNRLGLRRRALPARSAPASASMKPHPFGSSPTARCGRCSEPTITAKDTPPPSPRSCRRGSGCRSKKSR